MSCGIYLILYASISFWVKDAITLRAGDKNEVISTPNPKCVEIIDATCSSLSVPCKREVNCCHHATCTEDGGEWLLLSMTSISRKSRIRRTTRHRATQSYDLQHTTRKCTTTTRKTRQLDIPHRNHLKRKREEGRSAQCPCSRFVLTAGINMWPAHLVWTDYLRFQSNRVYCVHVSSCTMVEKSQLVEKSQFSFFLFCVLWIFGQKQKNIFWTKKNHFSVYYGPEIKTSKLFFTLLFTMCCVWYRFWIGRRRLLVNKTTVIFIDI